MISKLTIDKSSMNISYFLYTIKIIASNGGKITRKDFVKEMADFVGVPATQNDKENRTAYNKSKLPRYFGFVDTTTDENEKSNLVLTHRGKILINYIKDNGVDVEPSMRYSIINEHRMDFIDLIFDSVIFDSFGKNNSGAEQSNTDVEPPKVVFKTIYELGRATAEEICYVMFGLNRGEFNTFEEAISKVKENRSNYIYDYSKIMEEWQITNIVHDCKIINIFTDSSISLLISERNIENGKVYYQLSKNLSDHHVEQLKTISAVYEPLKLFAYTNSNEKILEKWIKNAVLGRISDNSQIMEYEFGKESEPFCSVDDSKPFEPGLFEKAILKSFNNEKKNIYLFLKNITENSFFNEVGRYATLFNRIENVKDEWHGWSLSPIEDERLYTWLKTNSVRAKNILKENKVVLPSNLHIVGMIIMNEENKNTKFDYKFRRCLIDIDNDANNEDDTSNIENTIVESKSVLDRYKKFYMDYLQDAANQELIEKSSILRREFIEEYPLERLRTLTLEDYALGTPNYKNALSYKLEFGKYKNAGLGIGGGSAAKHGIYLGKDNNYHNHKNDIISTPEEAWIELRNQVYSFLRKIGEINAFPNIDEYPLVKNIPIVAVKLCYLYYPEKFVSIGKKGTLEDIIEMFGLNISNNVVSANKSYEIAKYIRENIPEVNENDPQYIGNALWKFVSAIDEDDMDEIIEKVELKSCLEIERKPRTDKVNPFNLIVYGAPGTGKTYSMVEYALSIIDNKKIDNFKKKNTDRNTNIARYKNLVKDGQIVFTTFHQNYGYEEFIQGLRLDKNSTSMSFKVVDGIFKTIADKALNDSDNKNYVIIIDEINRANISKVFGELITLIEEDKRWGEVNEMSATLQSGDVFAVPNNLYIVGTMNSADKSISLIDAALRRRFEFVEQRPDSNLIKNETLKKIHICFNEKLVEELDSTDLLIGHSYFMNKTETDLCSILNNSIIPLLYEYFYDNRRKVGTILKYVLQNTEVNIEIVDEKVGRLRVKRGE